MKANSTQLKFELLTAVYASFLLASTVYTAPAFAQGMSSGPTAARKEDSRLLEGARGNHEMRGNLGVPNGSVGNLGGAVVLASCLAERSQIAKLTELNRLLEEKVSELSKKNEKNQVVQKTGDKK